MKALLKHLALGLLLLAPFSPARAQAAPLLSPIANMSLNAGSTRSLDVVAVDPDGGSINITAALPPFATLNAPTVGMGVVVTSLTLNPSTAQVGDYSAQVTAMAGGVSSVRVFQITVNAEGSDQAPVVVTPALREVTEGASLAFTVTATDPDGDAIGSLTPSGAPSGATFTPNGSNTSGAFAWTPGMGDAGEYDVQFTASNALSGTANTHIRVASAPTLAITPIDDVTVPAGGTMSIPVHAGGVPGALISLTASLPSFATLNPPGSGTGAVSTTIDILPPTGSAGTYHASVTAVSLGVFVTENFDIIVTGGNGQENHAPQVTAPASETVAVGDLLEFDVTATDPDGDHVDLLGTELPPGSSFTDHGNQTGTFSWTPTMGMTGANMASFTGLDNRGGSGTASTLITVTGAHPANRAPVLTAPLTQQVDEGVNLAFTVTASDQDGDHVTLTADQVPSGASFTDNGDNSAAFSWTPSNTQSGTYNVAFTGNDGRGGTGTAGTMITVMDVPDGGGGEGEVPGKACLVGDFKPHNETTCFRLKPDNGSFALGDVVLSSISLKFHNGSIHALDGATIEVVCPTPRGHGDRPGHHDDAAALLGGHRPGDWHDGDDDHDHGYGNNDRDQCGLSCKEFEDHGDCNRGRHNNSDCDTLGIRACFSTQALTDLFHGTGGVLPCDLADAQIVATLTNGATVVAVFHGHQVAGNGGGNGGGNGDGNGDGNGGGNGGGNSGGNDGDKGDNHDGRGRHGHGVLCLTAMPNPLNPSTVLAFTMSREGNVRVTIYDMKGRLVRTLLDGFRSAGQQLVAWDGSNSTNGRVASGVYFFRIEAPEATEVQRVAVVK
jgi:hypothetical protein